MPPQTKEEKNEKRRLWYAKKKLDEEWVREKNKKNNEYQKEKRKTDPLWSKNERKVKNEWHRERVEAGCPTLRNKRTRNNAKRRAVKLSATLEWTSTGAVNDIYNNCPPEHEVDHIIPLINEKVCGLHVPCNLQYLTKEENRKKGNKFHG
jgi:hypothetical protein